MGTVDRKLIDILMLESQYVYASMSKCLIVYIEGNLGTVGVWKSRGRLMEEGIGRDVVR